METLLSILRVLSIMIWTGLFVAAHIDGQTILGLSVDGTKVVAGLALAYSGIRMVYLLDGHQ